MEVKSISGGDVIPSMVMTPKSEVRREEPPAEEPLNKTVKSADEEGKGQSVDRYA